MFVDIIVVGIISIHKIQFKKKYPPVCMTTRYRVYTIYCFHTMSYEIWAFLSEDSQKNCISKQRSIDRDSKMHYISLYEFMIADNSSIIIKLSLCSPGGACSLPAEFLMRNYALWWLNDEAYLLCLLLQR